MSASENRASSELDGLQETRELAEELETQMAIPSVRPTRLSHSVILFTILKRIVPLYLREERQKAAIKELTRPKWELDS